MTNLEMVGDTFLKTFRIPFNSKAFRKVVSSELNRRQDGFYHSLIAEMPTDELVRLAQELNEPKPKRKHKNS